MNAKNTLLITLLTALLIASSALADVKLPAVIGENMVLQQNSHATIWGWADAGEKITVRAGWKSRRVTTTADADGKWSLKVQTPKAGGPYKLVIKANNRIAFQNILIGEVWVCSGQSNMQWTVSNSNNSEEEIAKAKYPNIRLFYVTREVSETPKDDCQGNWQECSPETIPGFSAVAYFYGRKLHNDLDIPIGLIHTSWGGTPAEAWTRRDILESNKDFKPICDRYQTAVDNWTQIKANYDKKVDKWKEAVEKAKAEGTKRPGYPRQPYGPGHPHSPAGLYNAMIAPLLPYTIKGAIWYQGESNAGRAYQYRTLFPAMIKNWRDDWNLGCFPFYFVQIAPFKGQTPEIRNAQLIAYRNTPNTGIVVTTDIGNVNDIHPRNKQDVGNRLGLWALANTYGCKDIVYSGPLYKSFKVEGDKIRITFDNIGSGLVAKDGDLTYFTIAEEGKDFVPAKAVIDGDTILVSCEQVKKPVAVRFAWENSPEPNLFNKEALPASPFRTDDRPGTTFGNY